MNLLTCTAVSVHDCSPTGGDGQTSGDVQLSTDMNHDAQEKVCKQTIKANVINMFTLVWDMLHRLEDINTDFNAAAGNDIQRSA